MDWAVCWYIDNYTSYQKQQDLAIYYTTPELPFKDVLLTNLKSGVPFKLSLVFQERANEHMCMSTFCL